MTADRPLLGAEPGVFPGQKHKISAFSLRWRLTLLVVAAIIPLLFFNLEYLYSEYTEDVAAAGNQTLALARSISILVDEQLDGLVSNMQTLAASRSLADGDLSTFRTRAEAVVAQQFPGGNILLMREDGQQMMNTILPPEAPLPKR